MTPRPRRLVVSDHAFRQLLDLRDAILATSGSQETADGYMRALHAYLHQLPDFPMRGQARPDIHPGLRILGFRSTLAIAFVVYPEALVVMSIDSSRRERLSIEHHPPSMEGGPA